MLLVLLPRSTVTSDRLFWTKRDQMVASHSLSLLEGISMQQCWDFSPHENLYSWLSSPLLSEDSWKQFSEVWRGGILSCSWVLSYLPRAGMGLTFIIRGSPQPWQLCTCPAACCIFQLSWGSSFIALLISVGERGYSSGHSPPPSLSNLKKESSYFFCGGEAWWRGNRPKNKLGSFLYFYVTRAPVELPITTSMVIGWIHNIYF